MRISLLHGEDSVKAYEKYRALIDGAKKKNFEIININNIKDVTGQTLFDDKIVFTLVNPKKVKLSEWKWFKENSAKYNSNLLIYWEGNAPATVTRNFPKDATITKFEMPKILFTFLDAIYPGNLTKVLKLFNELVQVQPVELILFMMARHVRDLYWASVDPASMPGPDWKNIKLAKQADRFEGKKLERLIIDLAKADVKSKTGRGNLESLLEMVFVKDLE